MGSSSEWRQQKRLIVSRHGLTTETRYQPNRAKLVLLESLLSRPFVIVERWSVSFIKVCVRGICVWRIKEELVWAIDKQFQFTISYQACRKQIEIEEAISRLVICIYQMFAQDHSASKEVHCCRTKWNMFITIHKFMMPGTPTKICSIMQYNYSHYSF